MNDRVQLRGPRAPRCVAGAGRQPASATATVRGSDQRRRHAASRLGLLEPAVGGPAQRDAAAVRGCRRRPRNRRGRIVRRRLRATAGAARARHRATISATEDREPRRKIQVRRLDGQVEEHREDVVAAGQREDGEERRGSRAGGRPERRLPRPVEQVVLARGRRSRVRSMNGHSADDREQQRPGMTTPGMNDRRDRDAQDRRLERRARSGAPRRASPRTSRAARARTRSTGSNGP